MGFRVKLVLCRLGLAEVMLQHYLSECAGVLEHPDATISEFKGMNMQPSLERSLRHRDILKA